MDNLPNLDDLYSPKSYDELEKIINEWLDAGAPDEDTARSMQQNEQRSPAPAQQSNSDTSTASNASSTKYKDLDDAFNDLANF